MSASDKQRVGPGPGERRAGERRPSERRPGERRGGDKAPGAAGATPLEDSGTPGVLAQWTQGARRWLRAAFVDNAALKFVALVLSVALFILVNTNQERLITIELGVVYTMPDDRVLVSETVDKVQVAIKGSWRLLKSFDQRELEPLSVDLSNLRSGEYLFPKEDIRLPEGLSLLSINPVSARLRFEPLISNKTAAVEVPTLGRPERGYKVDRIVPKPSQVAIRGAESLVAVTDTLSTRELDLAGRSESFSVTLPLVRPREPPVFEVVDGTTVEVEVVLVEEMTTRSIDGLAIALRAAADAPEALAERFTTVPKRVDLILRGPLLAVEGEIENYVAYVELVADDATSKPRQAVVRVDGAPGGVGVEVVPSTVMVRPVGRSQ
ncbi:MAG: CdaR family protein [Myxococcota bacterium]